MIHHYTYSKVGQYHIDAGSDICQDAANVIVIADDVVIAAVADGVGSEEHSEYASQAAVKACCEYCRDHYRELEPLALLNNSFYAALFAVQDTSHEKNVSMDQLHCTLCAALYTKECVYTGNVGDSGAIGLGNDGNYVLLTKPQNDEEGRVMPLTDEHSWTFEKHEGNFSGILVATDGFYNYLFPPYLPEAQKTDFNSSKRILDEERISEYIDSNIVPMYSSDTELEQYFETKIDAIPRESSLVGIIDDLTVIGLLSDVIPKKTARMPLNRNELITEYTELVRKLLYSPEKTESDDKLSESEYIDPPTEILPPNGRIYDDTNSIMKSDFETRQTLSKEPTRYIFEVEEDVKFVRILDEYLCSSNEDLLSTLKKLISLKNEEIKDLIELPYKLVYSSDNTLVGYLVHKAPEYIKLSECYNTPVQKRLGIAYILSNKLSKLNDFGIHLLSIDDNNVTYDDENFTVHFIEPLIESIKISDDTTAEPKESLSLGIMIFKLLFNGTEPFYMDKYIFDNPKSEYTNVPRMDYFPPKIQELFCKTFTKSDDAGMPTSKDWMKAFQQQPEELKKCKNDPTHLHYKELNICPYCECKGYTLELPLSNRE